MKILATTSLPAVDRPNADRWNAAHSRQKVGTSHPRIIFRETSAPKLHNDILLFLLGLWAGALLGLVVGLKR